MKKKGFTLIELLAVIVILVIISVIAIPRILNVVEEAKKGSAEASALGYIDAVEKQIMINATSKQYAEIGNGTYDLPMAASYGVNVKGETPTDGEVVIENSKVSSYEIYISGYIITFDGTTREIEKDIPEECTEYEENEVVYTRTAQGTEVIPALKCTGKYKLEVWGAQGGNVKDGLGGYGGYSVGTIKLKKNQQLSVTVGSAGSNWSSSTYGYNGGGAGGGGSQANDGSSGVSGASGGGATHIAYEKIGDGLLKDYKDNVNKIIIVAGGGGGIWYSWGRPNSINGTGGAGGGYMGADGVINTTETNRIGTGGTQTSGAAFGQGGGNYSGGGGGFYGGKPGNSIDGSASGGGSGYIGNTKLKNKKMVMFTNDDKYVSNDPATKTEKTNQYSTNPEPNKAKSGSGAAKITYVGN